MKVGDYVRVLNPGQTYTVGWCKDNPEYFEPYDVIYKKPWLGDYRECKGITGTVVHINGSKAIVKYRDNYAFAIDPCGLEVINNTSGDDLFD